MNPSYFDKEPLVYIGRAIFSYYDTHHSKPTKEVIIEEVRGIIMQLRLEVEEGQILFQWVDYILGVELPDADYIRQKVLAFGKKQAFRQAIVECIQTLKVTNGDVSKLMEMEGKLRNALKVGESMGDETWSLSTAVHDIHSRMAPTSSDSPMLKVPLPFPTMQKATNGGLSGGELMIVMARMGVGKTQFAINCAAMAIAHGMDVVHYAIGDMSEVDLAVRYTSRLYGVLLDDIITNSDKFKARKATVKLRGDIKIKYFSPSVTTVEHVISHYERLVETSPRTPSLVIVDYPDQFKGATKDNMYNTLGDIYDRLKWLGDEFKVALILPSQVHRSHEGVIELKDISNSDQKGAKADIAISLNQTREEAEAKKMRVWLDKNRRGESKKLFAVQTQFEMALMREVQDTGGVQKQPQIQTEVVQ
jgi:hypothetical protein